MAMGGGSAFDLSKYAAGQRAREMQAARDVTSYVSSPAQSAEQKLAMGQMAQQQAAAMAGNNPLAARQALIGAAQPALQIGAKAAEQRQGEIQQARQQQLAAYLRQREYEGQLGAEELRRRQMAQQAAQQMAQSEFQKQQQQAEIVNKGILGALNMIPGMSIIKGMAGGGGK